MQTKARFSLATVMPVLIQLHQADQLNTGSANQAQALIWTPETSAYYRHHWRKSLALVAGKSSDTFSSVQFSMC